jgi:TolB-like protein
VGAALGYAHDHNVIHSDLKPANVFVTNSGRTKLLDFGIARVSRGPLLHASSGPRALTPAYASCEMLEGKEADRRDDIYSFVCMIYEMLSGERPFGERTALQARDDGAQVPPLHELSPEQNAALAQALAFDRAGRTAAVESLLSGLRADVAPRAHPTPAVVAGIIAATAAAVGLTYFALDKLWLSRHSVMVQSQTSSAQQAASAATTSATFNPPPHSIAVLPFVNLSGDASQDYFSDGLTEELLNSLAEIEGLQVAARISSFSFKEHPDIVTVAHKLNVAAVLEGSVRRSANTVRVTAQLINTVTGFHLWSKTYDRDLGDVLKLQTEIATAVASALEVTLLGDVSAKIELGGTRNPAAFDAYLRGSKAYSTMLNKANDLQSAATVYQSAAAAYTEAIRLDPNYALAFAGRSMTLNRYAGFQIPPAQRGSYDKALADARRAIALAPELGEAHLALARVFEEGFLDFANAGDEYSRALSLAPGNARVLQHYGTFAVNMGRTEAGLAASRHAVMLDPLSTDSHYRLGLAQWASRRYNEAAASFEEVITLDPDASRAYAWGGFAYYGLGDLQSARSSCEAAVGGRRGWILFCLALVYDKLGRHVDAEAMVTEARAELGDAPAYQYAEVYAQWGNTAKALDWLDTAVRLRDPSQGWLKRDPLLDPLRKEPRFLAIERELNFPN